MTSCVAELNMIYFAPVEDFAIVGCFLLYQLTVQLPILKTYPEVDLRVSASPAQSASLYPISAGLLSSTENFNAKLSVPLRHRMIRFTPIQCSLLGLDMYCDKTLIVAAISGRVVMDT